MIKVSGLHHQVTQFDGKSLPLLQDINLSIKAAESVAIVGASGSGKTTLLSLLATLDNPSQGEIWIDNHNVAIMNEEERAAVRAQWVAFVFQSFQLLDNLTALENVLLPLEVRRHPQARQQAMKYLSRVQLDHRLQHFPAQLSGGEQQRVALARAFACEAPILFADEPTGNLDTHTGQVIADLLFELNREANTTLVLVTHDRTLAERCQRRFSMQAGRLEEIT